MQPNDNTAPPVASPRLQSRKFVEAEEAFIEAAVRAAGRSWASDSIADPEILATAAEAGCMAQRAALREAVLEALREEQPRDSTGAESYFRGYLRSYLHVTRCAVVGLCRHLIDQHNAPAAASK